MTSESQKKALKAYYERSKVFKRNYIFQLDNRLEPDLIDWLDKKKPRAEYIRKALREYMERGN